MMEPQAPNEFNDWTFKQAKHKTETIIVTVGIGFAGPTAEEVEKVYIVVYDPEMKANILDWAEGNYEEVEAPPNKKLVQFKLPETQTLTDILIQIDNLLELINPPP